MCPTPDTSHSGVDFSRLSEVSSSLVSVAVPLTGGKKSGGEGFGELV